MDIIAHDRGALTVEQPPVLIFLGDYIDRGVETKQVIDRIIAIKDGAARSGVFEVRALLGNHEQTMLAFLQNPEGGAAWMEFGGGETLVSYGLPRPAWRGDLESWREVQSALKRNLPTAHLDFLRELELSVAYGDYFFVHAGVRPGVPLNQQNPEDFLWIRGDFLDQPHKLGCIVVHGHTPREQPFLGRDRINIDTGAYATGVLTAVRLFDGAPHVLQARKSRLS
jgi:serine/threonine protein phosphatase 1